MTFALAETRRICAAATKGPWVGNANPIDQHWEEQHPADAAFITFARKNLPEACDVIEALCEMLDDEFHQENPNTWPPPDWPTVALARKQAKEDTRSEHPECDATEAWLKTKLGRVLAERHMPRDVAHAFRQGYCHALAAVESLKKEKPHDV